MGYSTQTRLHVLAWVLFVCVCVSLVAIVRLRTGSCLPRVQGGDAVTSAETLFDSFINVPLSMKQDVVIILVMLFSKRQRKVG